MEKVHIGSIIKKVARAKGFTAAQLGNKINLTDQGVYSLYRKESIDTSQLKLISEVLEYDFFQYYSSLMERVKFLENENAMLRDHITFLKGGIPSQ